MQCKIFWSLITSIFNGHSDRPVNMPHDNTVNVKSNQLPSKHRSPWRQSHHLDNLIKIGPYGPELIWHLG